MIQGLGEGLAGVKLIIAIAALVLLLVLVFGKPLTGFRLLDLMQGQTKSPLEKPHWMLF